MPKTDQEKAEKLYIEGGSSYAALAKKFKVSERTIKRWAEAGGWQAKKKSQELASQAIAAEVSEVLQKRVPSKSVLSHFQGEEVDMRQIYSSAAVYLHSAYPEAQIKSAEAAIATIARIGQAIHQMEMHELDLELKRKEIMVKDRQLNPPTVQEWAKLAVQYEYNSKELMAEVRAALRAAVGA